MPKIDNVRVYGLEESIRTATLSLEMEGLIG